MIEWHSIAENPPEVDEATYLVAIVNVSGNKLTATALVNCENGKYFWEIQHVNYEIYYGNITAWAEMPEYPEGFNG